MTKRNSVWLKLWCEPDQESKLFNSIKQMKGVELEKFDRSTDHSEKNAEEVDTE